MHILSALAAFFLVVGLAARSWRLHKERAAELADPGIQLLRRYERDVDTIELRLITGMKALGFNLLTPTCVAKDPSLLEDCDRFDRATPLVDEWRLSMEERFARHERDMSNAPVDEQFKPTIAEGLAGWRTLYAVYLPRRVELTKRQIATTCRLCRLLARRNWHIQNDSFGFFSTDELADFQEIVADLNDLGAQQRQVIMDTSRAD